MKITIGREIAFPFFVMLILLIGMSGITYQGFKKVTANLDNMELESVKRGAAGNLRFNITQLLMPANDYILTQKQYYQREFDRINLVVDNFYHEFNRLPLTDEEQRLSVLIKQDLDSIRAYSAQIFSIPNPRQSPKAWALMETMDYRFGEAVNKKTTQIFEGISKRVEKYRLQAADVKENATKLIFGGTLVGAFISIIVAFLTVRRISKPIITVAKIADRIANGDYSTHPEVKTHDEVAILANSFNIMADSIQQSQKTLKESKRLIEAIVSTVPVGLLVFDANGKILSVNNAFCNSFGIDQNLLLEQNIIPMFEKLKVSEECRNHILSHKPMSDIECNYMDAVKGARILNLSLNPIPLNERKSLLMVEDITKRKHDEEIVINNEKHFRALIENSTDGLCVISPDGHLLYDSPSNKNISGYEHNELINKNILTLFHSDDLPAANDLLADLQKEPSELAAAEVRCLHKDGTWRWIEITAKSSLQNTTIAGIIINFHDITERKRAEEEFLKLSRVVEQSPALVIITNKKGTIEYVNEKFIEISGYSRNEVIGKNPRIWKSGYHDKKFYKELWTTILSGNDYKCEMLNKKKNGELYWEAATISPLIDKEGKITHFVDVKEDITAKKKMIEELIIAKEKAEEMNRLKSSFLANMSHELRTPLIGILGFSQILAAELENPEQVDMLNSIYQTGERLRKTLNIILDLAKVESGQIELQMAAQNIVPLVQLSTDLFSGAAQKKGLYLRTVATNAILTTTIDQRLFADILNNLLNNAVSYTETGSITVKIGKEKLESKDWVYISITDTGIGIAKKDFEYIFEEFRQVSEGFSRSFDGTGLGLTLTKKYVELMQGVIILESQVGVGSTFTIKFPLYETDLPETKTETSETQIQSASGGDEKISLQELPLLLYVEDEDISQRIVGKFLLGICKLAFAKTGQEAIELANKTLYNGFLMDINLLSGMDGEQVTKELRKLPQYAATPIIAVTAFAMQGDKEEFIEAGCTDYISKPFSRDELVTLIKKYFRK